MTKYVNASPVAVSIPFNNATNGFVAKDVQSAIEEVVNKSAYAEITLTNTITTTSESFVTMGLDLTPPAGTYIAMLFIEHTSNVLGINNTAEFGIFIAGTAVTSSLKTVGVTLSGISLASIAARSAASTSALITVNGSQLVQGGWRRETGSTTHTLTNRQLILLKVS